MTVISPTGTCFDDAMGFLFLFRLEDPTVRMNVMRTVRVAHGICTTPSGIPFAHAWVEERVEDDPDRTGWPARVVWQGMKADNGRKAYFAVEAGWFMRAYGVRDRTLYTIRDCMARGVASDHAGPWIARYRKHLGHEVLEALPDVSVLGVLEL